MKQRVVIKTIDGKMGFADIEVTEGEDLSPVLTASDGTTAEFTGDWVDRFDGPPWPVYQEVGS